MHLTKLNNSHKLVGKAATLKDHKQWILAVASGNVNQVAALVKAGLNNYMGICGLIAAYQQAAMKLYCPQDYLEDDIMQSIVMLHLGGACVAEFAHLLMALPSPRTAQWNTVIQPLVVSPSQPTVNKVKSNILSCLEALDLEDSTDDWSPDLVFAGPVHVTEKTTRTEPNWTD